MPRIRRAVAAVSAAALTLPVGLVGLVAPTTAQAASTAPTQARIALAVRAATHARSLWATVNVCQRQSSGGGTIGVRGEMPALGFPASLSMRVTLRTQAAGSRIWTPVEAATATHVASLGLVTSGVHQDGAEFPYRANAGMLDATITFTWSREGRTLAQVTRTTTAGHPAAAYSRPAGFSAASCRL